MHADETESHRLKTGLAKAHCLNPSPPQRLLIYLQSIEAAIRPRKRPSHKKGTSAACIYGGMCFG